MSNKNTNPAIKEMSEIEFCKYWCDTLTNPMTESQLKMAEYKIVKGEFLGVGRAIGRTSLMPLVLVGITANVIDRAGHYQLASLEGRIGYTCP